MSSTVDIDKKRLEREAKNSEHNEAYEPIWEREGIRIGVGARFFNPDGITFFIEVILPNCSGSQVDLEILERKLEVLRRLEEGGFSITCQDDMSFCCELMTRITDVEKEYTRAAMLVERFLRGEI